MMPSSGSANQHAGCHCSEEHVAVTRLATPDMIMIMINVQGRVRQSQVNNTTQTGSLMKTDALQDRHQQLQDAVITNACIHPTMVSINAASTGMATTAAAVSPDPNQYTTLPPSSMQVGVNPCARSFAFTPPDILYVNINSTTSLSCRSWRKQQQLKT